jgi:hypothetical protein
MKARAFQYGRLAAALDVAGEALKRARDISTFTPDYERWMADIDAASSMVKALEDRAWKEAEKLAREKGSK